jgi:hypothetical protein
MVAILGLMEVPCLLALLITTKDAAGTGWTAGVLVSITALICQFIINVSWQGVYWAQLHNDERFSKWRASSIKNKISLVIILLLSTLFSFKFFRLIYSRFIGR